MKLITSFFETRDEARISAQTHLVVGSFYSDNEHQSRQQHVQATIDQGLSRLTRYKQTKRKLLSRHCTSLRNGNAIAFYSRTGSDVVDCLNDDEIERL